MSNFIKTSKDIKNKNGKIIERVLNIQPKNGKLTITEINKLYNKLRDNVNPKNIMIKVIAIDGWKTVKAYDYDDEDLTVVYEDYYSSLSKDTRDKYDNLLGVQFITK